MKGKTVLITGLVISLIPGFCFASETCKSNIVESTFPNAQPVIQSVSYTPFCRQGEVLFVEDPGDSFYGPIKKPDSLWQVTLNTIFDPGGYGWYGPTLTRSENGPDSIEMMNYELVIWNCYDYWFRDTAALTADDTTNIAAYLRSQGKVWLIGQDLLWSGVPMNYMLAYFHLQSATQDYIEDEPDINLRGLAEIDSITFLATSDYLFNGFYPDELAPDASAHVVLKDTDMNKNVGIFYPGPSDWQTAFWTIDGRNPNSYSKWIDMVAGMLLAFGITGIRETTGPQIVHLPWLAISPDPVGKQTTISYTLPVNGKVHLAIFNRAGQHVVTLVDGQKSAGSYTQVWKARDKCGVPVPNGVYFVRLESNKLTRTANIVVVR